MAEISDINALDISGWDTAKVTRKAAAGTMSAGAAAFAIPMGAHSRSVLFVQNDNTDTAVQVVLQAGNGPAAGLGSLKQTVPVSNVAAIPLYETARLLGSDKKITAALTTAENGDLSAAALAKVKLVLIQG